MPLIVYLLSDGLAFLFVVLIFTQVVIPAIFNLPTWWLFSRSKRNIIDSKFNKQTDASKTKNGTATGSTNNTSDTMDPNQKMGSNTSDPTQKSNQ